MFLLLVLVHLALCAFAADHQSSLHTLGVYPSDIRGQDGVVLIPGHIYAPQSSRALHETGSPNDYVVYIGPIEDSRRFIFVSPLNPHNLKPGTKKLKAAECFDNAGSLFDKDETFTEEHARISMAELLHLPPEHFRHATLKGKMLREMQSKSAIAFERECREGQCPEVQEILVTDRIERNPVGHAAKAA